MIYTLTLNPSLDVKISFNSFSVVSGGKGINVSTLLAINGIESTALGFVGKAIGKDILRRLNPKIIKDFTVVKNSSRINWKFKFKKEYERNGKGPYIFDKEKQDILDKVAKLNKEDYLIISGTVPNNIDKMFYVDIIKQLNETKFIIDATKDLLLSTLKYEPELVKPNIYELEETFGVKIKGIDEIKEYGNKLLDMGAKRVIVSLGEDGLVYLSKNKCIIKPAKKGKVLSTVGAGDALVAGFVAGLTNNRSEEECVENALVYANSVVFDGVLL